MPFDRPTRRLRHSNKHHAGRNRYHYSSRGLLLILRLRLRLLLLLLLCSDDLRWVVVRLFLTLLLTLSIFLLFPFMLICFPTRDLSKDGARRARWWTSWWRTGEGIVGGQGCTDGRRWEKRAVLFDSDLLMNDGRRTTDDGRRTDWMMEENLNGRCWRVFWRCRFDRWPRNTI